MCNYKFSPDNRYLAYNCTRPMGINVISVETGTLQSQWDSSFKAFEPSVPSTLPGEML